MSNKCYAYNADYSIQALLISVIITLLPHLYNMIRYIITILSMVTISLTLTRWELTSTPVLTNKKYIYTNEQIAHQAIAVFFNRLLSEHGEAFPSSSWQNLVLPFSNVNSLNPGINCMCPRFQLSINGFGLKISFPFIKNSPSTQVRTMSKLNKEIMSPVCCV